MPISHIIPNFKSSSRSDRIGVELVVMHSTAGSTLQSTIQTLRLRGLGYHYLIERDGSIHKGCPASHKTGHAGNSFGPREERNGVSRKQFRYSKLNVRLGRVGKFVAGCSVNEYSIGISFCNLNDGSEPITSVQLDAAAELIKELRSQLPQLKYITTHAEVSKGRKTDPKLFDLDSFAHRTGLAAWRLPAPQQWDD